MAASGSGSRPSSRPASRVASSSSDASGRVVGEAAAGVVLRRRVVGPAESSVRPSRRSGRVVGEAVPRHCKLRARVDGPGHPHDGAIEGGRRTTGVVARPEIEASIDSAIDVLGFFHRVRGGDLLRGNGTRFPDLFCFLARL